MYISMVALKAADTYEQHQAIWSLFLNTPNRRRDHLFRVENKAQSGDVTVLLQSATEPVTSSKCEVLQSKLFNPTLENEAFYKFKLVAYPTKCLSEGKRVIEIHDENQQIEWLHRKLKGANVNVTALESYLVKNQKSFNLRFVCFEGVLQITHADSIRNALVMGVGRQKHAGAGLLSLAKAN